MKALNLPLPHADVNHFVDQCLPFSLFEQVAEVLSLSDAMLGQYLGIPPCTLSRMASAGHFSASESLNLLALIRVLYSAYGLFEGDAQAVRVFLTSPARSLNSKTPLEVLRAGGKASIVLDVIGRLEHGIPL